MTDEAWWHIGQKNVKLFLNKKIKQGDFNAYIYKTLVDESGLCEKYRREEAHTGRKKTPIRRDKSVQAEI